MGGTARKEAAVSIIRTPEPSDARVRAVAAL